MKIAILTTSARIGGAAIVTARMADALAAAGHTVRLFTMDGGVRRELRPSFLSERAGIFLRNGLSRDNLFKMDMADFGLPGIVGRVRRFAPDIIVLGWVNQGFLSLGQIRRLASVSRAPLVWIMHDMWNFTGLCHHSLGCMNFTGRCGDCPLLLPAVRRRSDLSHTGWKRKNRLYSDIPVHFVAVSHWLRRLAARSTLLRDCDVSVIPNVFPLGQFAITEKEPGLIVMGAERLDDPIKGLHHAVAALNRLAASDPVAHVVFFGSIRDTSLLQSLRMPWTLTGPLDREGVAALLGRARAILSTSLYETLPTTLIEGQACGAVPVTFDRGGQADIVDHMRSGFLAPFGDEEAIARGLSWALSGRVDPASLRREVEKKFSAGSVARRYDELFESLLLRVSH